MFATIPFVLQVIIVQREQIEPSSQRQLRDQRYDTKAKAYFISYMMFTLKLSFLTDEHIFSQNTRSRSLALFHVVCNVKGPCRFHTRKQSKRLIEINVHKNLLFFTIFPVSEVLLFVCFVVHPSYQHTRALSPSVSQQPQQSERVNDRFLNVNDNEYFLNLYQRRWKKTAFQSVANLCCVHPTNRKHGTLQPVL